MACFRLLTAYRGPKGPSGKRGIVFDRSKSVNGIPLHVPCGQCIGCRLERSRQWAIRCVHEAQLHPCNAFITLTYNDQNLPPDGSLSVLHFQGFMKRLRKNTGAKMRYFHCGEYGPKFGRPHYHACVFGYDFPDKELFKSARGTKLYTSAILDKAWQHQGFTTVGDVTFESAAYVARYIMKKITGDQAHDHYWKVNEQTGECVQVDAEYTTMSRGDRSKDPIWGHGIGSGWLQQFKSDVYPSDQVVINGVKMRPPKFYDSRYEIEDPEAYEKLKLRRRRNSIRFRENNTPERLAVREKCKEAQINQLKRGYENEA